MTKNVTFLFDKDKNEWLKIVDCRVDEIELDLPPEKYFLPVFCAMCARKPECSRLGPVPEATAFECLKFLDVRDVGP